jgi:hypothetical protein
MDQRSTIGTSLPLDRPIHRACVVAGCWCGSTTTADTRSARTTSERGSARRPIRGLDADSTKLTGTAWRFVGLPVV